MDVQVANPIHVRLTRPNLDNPTILVRVCVCGLASPKKQSESPLKRCQKALRTKTDEIGALC